MRFLVTLVGFVIAGQSRRKMMDAHDFPAFLKARTPIPDVFYQPIVVAVVEVVRFPTGHAVDTESCIKDQDHVRIVMVLVAITVCRCVRRRAGFLGRRDGCPVMVVR